MPTLGNVTGLFGKAANTLRRLVPFGQAAPEPLANAVAAVNANAAVANAVNANVAANAATANAAEANAAAANAANAAANAVAKNTTAVVMGGKRRHRKHKKMTHKRRH